MKLYLVNENPKDKLRRKKYMNRRFYSALDMSIIKHDESVSNSQRKRGEKVDYPNAYIVQCGCGGVGCFIHHSFETKN